MNLKNLIPSVIVPVLVSVALSAVTARAASQTWTNAPVSQIWTNAGNWVGQAYPGAQSQTGNSINNDLATFNTPIPLSGIGGASAPIMIPGSPVITTTNRCLTVGGILFDTVNCGAYVFQTNQPTQYPSNGILYVSHNNSITISPTVTNSQTFLIPVFIRLPSSTAGIYNFINNASSPAVTLFFNSVTNDSATSRGTVFTLGGSNTGTNTIALLSKGTTTSGGMGLNKIGTGRWLLPNASDLASQSVNTINDGTLEVQNAGSLGVPVGTTINSNGVLQVDNITLNQGFFSLQRNGTYRLNGSGTVSNFNIGTAIGGITTPRIATTSSGDVLTVNAVTNGASDATVHIIGPGTVVLGAGATPYIGNWSFDAGKTVVTNASALGTGGLASVGPGAVLDLTTLGASWTPTVGALGGTGSAASGSLAATITAASGATINLVNKGVTITFTPTGFSGDLTHPSFILSAGNLSIGTTTFTIDNASGTPLGVGTYLIAQQSSGSISDAGSHVVLMNGSGVQFGTIGTIQTSGGNLYLVVVPYTSRPLSWKGGNPNSTWDTVIKNWWDGIQYTNFNTSDYATFDAVGATNPVVNIPGTVVPTTLVVNTAATNYTFSGTGLIGGNASLTKMSSGTLTLATVNSYIGGTTISNGTIKVGANNALPASGTLTFVNNTATLDLNGFNDALGSITGNGIIDNNNGAAASTLTLGSDGSSGTFSGVIQSSSNNVQVVKTGTGVTTLNGANTYSGTNTVNNGTLAVTGTSALGNPTNNLVVNSGILSLGANVTVGSVTGAGNIENDANATTAFLTLGSPVASSFSGVISDGSGGGAVGVRIVNGASLSFSANFNGYSGGTYVGTNSTFTIQNGPAGVGGFLVASNGASLNLAGGSSTPGTPTNILTVDGATISLGSGALGKIWTGQFQGAANTTNRVLNTMSFGGDSSFKNFNGVVSLEQVGSARFLNVPTGSFGGGDAATFLFVNSGATILTRDAATILLGNIAGGTGTSGIDTATAGGTDTYIIGGKGTDSTFFGFIRGLNNIVKSGAGTLTLAGGFTTNIVDISGFGDYVTNIYTANLISYTGNTVISNGVLEVNVPDLLTNSPRILLAGPSAVLDASSMGWISNVTDNATFTNQVLITNGTLEIVSGEILGGVGTIRGSVLADLGSTLLPGNTTGSITNPATGVLTVTNTIEIAGAVQMALDTANVATCDELAAGSFIIDGTATLLVTNLGPTFPNGTKFQLFNHPVSFASVTLPATDPLGSPYTWTNNLAVDGSISLATGGGNPIIAPTNAPTIGNIIIAGSNITLTGTNSDGGATYYLLSSTNVATPLAQWKTVATNVAGGTSFTFIGTNVVTAGSAQQFYILSSTNANP